MKITKKQRRKRIHYRVRKKVSGTQSRPRLNVFRSNKSIYCQAIDDVNGVTLASASSNEADIAKDQTKTEQAKAVGQIIGNRMLAKDINTGVFDRNGYLYHGRVKALADGIRESGFKI